jgi:hypothetical protein
MICLMQVQCVCCEARPASIRRETRSVVSKMCIANPKRSATSSQGIRGYITVMATLKFTFLIKGITFFLNNRGPSLIDDMFTSYDRHNT